MSSDTYVFPSLLIIYTILVCMMLLQQIHISCFKCVRVLGFGCWDSGFWGLGAGVRVRGSGAGVRELGFGC